MCGRFLLATPADEIARAFGVVGASMPDWRPRYNIAPTQDVLIVRTSSESDRELARVRWGLIPSWAKDEGIGARTINARSETAATKPTFRAAFRARRCVVPADGFYEWKRVNGKQPMLIRRVDGRPLAMAGLWESWSSPVGPLETCTILTCNANSMVRAIHDRMPVILEPEELGRWLDPGVEDPSTVQEILDPAPDGVLAATTVSRAVNSPRNDTPECTRPVETLGGLFGS